MLHSSLTRASLVSQVYFNDIPVGTACCRLEKGSVEGEAKLYMMTMGVLAVSVDLIACL